MTKTITTYDELLAEKARLEELFKAQKELVRADIQDIKSEFAPVKAALSVVGKFTSREKGNWAMSATANTLIDLVVKKFLLGRAGWFTRMIIPFAVKNFSSHVIAENKQKIMSTVFSLFGKKKKQQTAESAQTVQPAGAPGAFTNGHHPVTSAETRED